MTHLERLERDVLAEHSSLSLRPTLEAVERIGGWLAEAKALLPHGQYLPWVRRCGISPRTAQDYMAVARAANTQHAAYLSRNLSLRQFLRLIRRAGREAVEAERDRLAGMTVVPDHDCQVVHADCRTWDGWPGRIDAVATDPPWADADAYRWLARFTAERLSPGGVLLCQVGHGHLADRLRAFQDAGLVYEHCLAIVYDQVRSGRPFRRWVPGWRPVLVLSQGRLSRLPRQVCDVQTVRHSSRLHHHWEQPVEPWQHWLGLLTRPGELVVDPFAGGGTIGAAVKLAGGGRRYLGIEIDGRAARVAQGRLATANL